MSPDDFVAEGCNRTHNVSALPPTHRATGVFRLTDGHTASAFESGGDSGSGEPGIRVLWTTRLAGQAADTGKWLAANPQQRALYSANRTWWLESLNGNPRYEALIKPSN